MVLIESSNLQIGSGAGDGIDVVEQAHERLQFGIRRLKLTKFLDSDIYLFLTHIINPSQHKQTNTLCPLCRISAYLIYPPTALQLSRLLQAVSRPFSFFSSPSLENEHLSLAQWQSRSSNAITPLIFFYFYSLSRNSENQLFFVFKTLF